MVYNAKTAKPYTKGWSGSHLVRSFSFEDSQQNHTEIYLTLRLRDQFRYKKETEVAESIDDVISD
jgi:hypothetical protein